MTCGSQSIWSASMHSSLGRLRFAVFEECGVFLKKTVVPLARFAGWLQSNGVTSENETLYWKHNAGPLPTPQPNKFPCLSIIREVCLAKQRWGVVGKCRGEGRQGDGEGKRNEVSVPLGLLILRSLELMSTTVACGSLLPTPVNWAVLSRPCHPHSLQTPS